MFSENMRDLFVKSAYAKEKVVKVEKLFTLWKEVDKVFNELQSKVKSYCTSTALGEATSFPSLSFHL